MDFSLKTHTQSPMVIFPLTRIELNSIHKEKIYKNVSILETLSIIAKTSPKTCRLMWEREREKEEEEDEQGRSRRWTQFVFQTQHSSWSWDLRKISWQNESPGPVQMKVHTWRRELTVAWCSLNTAPQLREDGLLLGSPWYLCLLTRALTSTVSLSHLEGLFSLLRDGMGLYGSLAWELVEPCFGGEAVPSLCSVLMASI